jgi:tetratricopeptide (TPR) repeat protein/mono/diheme cytochrome c family protein
MNALTRLGLASLLVAAVGPAASAAGPAPQALARKVRQIFQTHCHRCHGKEGANEGGFNYVLDRRQLVSRKKIVLGNAAKSKLYWRLTDPDDPMPPPGEKPRPGKDDLALIERWIDAGAPDPRPAEAKRPFLAPADVTRFIAEDLRSLPARDRTFTRYFTLTHLSNAGLAEDQLQSYRHALAKLVNSLSWGRRIVVPRPIDPARTVYRIDLRDYGWDRATWKAILAASPYGILADGPAARSCTQATGCKLPFVRGDWFVAAASRPPLYHEVLRLPATEGELERLLGVDEAEDVRRGRVARAGFNGSGVSRNNRLIERHEAGAVVYWKSYDFAGNTGRKNLFAHPLRPDEADSGFAHDGGEIIFTLPNHLQAYLLVGGRGNRIDKGPSATVSDPRRPDRAVENGLSCMSCHARGLIEKADQVRDHVAKNPRGFSAKDRAAVRAIYPPRERFLALLRGDARRFQQAVARTGAPLTATEPIAALALRFEAELDLALAAAEAGVRPGELLGALGRSPLLAKHLGTLQVQGGTVQRAVFVDIFPDLVAELKLGAFREPRRTAFERRIKEGNARLRRGDLAGAVRAYTEASRLDPTNPFAYYRRAGAHLDRGDYDRAVADYTRIIELAPEDPVAYNNRGLAFFHQGAYVRAVADLSEALRLDPGYAIAYHNRGLAYRGKKDNARAIADFTAALRIDPRYTRAYLNRAATYAAQADLQEAIADYTRALRLEPRSVVACNNRGLARYEREEYDGAVADFSAALRLDPKHAVAYYNRGLAYHDQGFYDRAIADFSAAVRINPRFARAYLGRSQSYAKKGDTARAQADRDRALRLDPDLDGE